MDITPTTYHELFNLLSNKDTPFVRPNAEGEISFEDAKKLFDAFAKLEDLYFEASDNGCGLRSGLMQNLLKAAGVKTTPLMAYYGYGRSWEYHFSPGIVLKDTKEIFVIDPTEEKEPISLKDWIVSNKVTERDITKPDFELGGTVNPDIDLKKLKSFAQAQALRVA